MANELDPIDFPALLSFGLHVVRLRLEVSTERLREALLLPVEEEHELPVNAAVAEWLDAVYAAREPYWTARHPDLVALQAEVSEGRMVEGAIYARGASTHHRVQPCEGYVDAGDWMNAETTWSWSERLDNPDGRDAALKPAYDGYLAASFVRDTVDPIAAFLLDILPARLPLA